MNVCKLSWQPLMQVLVLACIPATQAQQPAVPEEARKYFAQGNLVFKQAQSKADYAKAEALYQQALKLAPQWGNTWYNLSKAQEKLEKYGDAIASLKLFLQYSPNDPETRAAQDHMYELELKRDAQDKVIADQKRAESEQAARLRDRPAKADYLRRQLSGFTVRTVWTCISQRSRREGVWGCTDEEALGKNWGNVSDSSAIGTHPQVELVGSEELDLKVGHYTFCIKVDDYSLGQTEFPFQSCAPGTFKYWFKLNATWNGRPAIYTESCVDESCSTTDRNYFVYSR